MRLAMLLSPLPAMALLALTACERAPEAQISFDPDETEILVDMVFDTTGSFEDRLLGKRGEEGPAWRTAMQTMQRLQRDNLNTKMRLIITRIYGSKKAILLDSEPATFMQRFPRAEDFKDFLLSRPDPGGSRVYDSLRDTVDYLLLQHRNAKKLKSILITYSDMDDNVRDSADAKELLIESLKNYARAGGVVAVYGCDLNTVPAWSRVLDDCRFKSYVIEPDIRDNPKLPVVN